MHPSRKSLIGSIFLAACVCLGLTACGPGPTGNGDLGVVDDDAGTDGGEDDTSTDGGEEDTGDVDGGGPGEMSACQESSDVGESCDPNVQTPKGWACVDAGKGPICMKKCIQSEGETSPSCGGNEICLKAGGGDSNAPAVCFPSQCNGPGDQANCKNVSNHPRFGSYPDGAKCSNISIEACGSASICVPAGTQGTGDKCNADSPIFCQSQGSCFACKAGNVCQSGRCQAICSADDDCSGDSSCVGLDTEDVVGSGKGFCGKSCDPYDDEDECSSSGKGCHVLTNELGFCGEVGQKGYMEECSPPSASSPQKRDCKEGLTCGVFQQSQVNLVSRCVPVCAPPGSGDSRVLDNHATCGGTFHGRVAHAHSSPPTVDVAANGTTLIEDLAAGSTGAGQSAMGDFFSLDVDELDRGEVEVKVTDGSSMGGMNLLMSPNVTASSGRSRTWVLHWDGRLEVTPVPVPRDIEKPQTGSSEAKVRVTSLVSDYMANGNAVNVDVVVAPQSGSFSSDKVTLAEEMGSAAVGPFKKVDAGTYDLYVFDTSASKMKGKQILKIDGAFTVSARERTSVTMTGTFDSADNVDVTVTMIPYASPPDAPKFQCLSSGSGGICFNECEPKDYGTNWCASGASCHPLQGNLQQPDFCQPNGSTNKKPGDSCASGGYRECEEGAICRADGAGNGSCRSLCVGGSSTAGGTLKCGMNTTCTGGDGEIGACRQACMPGQNLEDTNCPQNLQSCIPQLTSDGMMTKTKAFCSASGSKSKGNSCGGQAGANSFLRQNCEPGTICAHPSGSPASAGLALQGMFTGRGDTPPGVCGETDVDTSTTEATCRQTCEPFAKDPGCPKGQACGLAFNYATPLVGVCLETGDGISSAESSTTCGAENAGKLCGTRSYCVPLGGGLVNNCIQFCNAETGKGCEGDKECEQSSFGTGVGLCTPFQ